ncbi:cholesterol oxidase substrate-binding domain-containing protein [Variovorax sp. J22R133]|uniref:cholesterol oxidase substrate-binding domain-containing protein n=1 Tax=Variovorax brevis TaxID=3053503 RepID=UPI002577767B|nr:cholesterol oxidase substrate-binding domain-containing protein [Variovorax sp. J22R133]MDM0110879.1 cholesterol oxidase substrate-binding domain-containing protein [Variovorax sp. J22R133]
MVEAQRIACSNDGWYTMSFTARSDGFESPATGTIWRGQQQVIDLANYPVPEGLSFMPGVSIDADGRSHPPPPPAAITFKMNGRTAFYDVTGNVWTWEAVFNKLGDPSGRPTLPGFPADVPLNVLPYHNWDNQINSPGMLTCAPQSAGDVVAVCNWAKDNGYQVRPRGVMHGWSPLTVAVNPDPKAKILLVDFTKGLCQATVLAASGGLPTRVKVQTGKTMLDLLKYLEAQPGGKGPAPGYSFPHTPAPGNLTVGGVLAIDAHGTAVPTPPHDDFAASYGSMSNQILEFTAVVTDPDSTTPDQYSLRTFKRGEVDAKLFLAHVGRALLVDATLQVIDNYNLRCQSFTNFSDAVVFAAPSGATPIPKDSFADYLERCGRVEVIWFRTGTNPWLHVWSVEASKPGGSTAVSAPYNYPFADHVPDSLQKFLKMLLNGVPSATPLFGQTAANVTANGLDGKNMVGQSAYPPSRDIWGPSKNSLLYIQDTTLQVTANGYALQMKKADVQQAVHDFTTKFSSLLASYESASKYPINSAVEIRVTSLDDPARVAAGSGQGAESPLISALSFDDTAKQNGWDVALWVDVLTLPGTEHANAFYAELEQWLLQRFSGKAARALPEWSKGWAYSAGQGAWTDTNFLAHVREAFSTGRTDRNNWKFAVDGLKKYDKSNLYSNPLLEQLFTG